MPWYTITDSIDADFGVDEWHGHNVFFRQGARVFRNFINSRGDEAIGTVWSYLDAAPLGCQAVSRLTFQQGIQLAHSRRRDEDHAPRLKLRVE
jgi:predicted dithiol-disulfide oxidoreductase (DUF899 family)